MNTKDRFKLSGYGAIWLILATLLTKLIGVLQKIPLQNFAGDAVFGIYNVVYPIYQLMMALAIAGIPTALATYMSGLDEKNKANAFRVAIHMSIIAAIMLSLVLFLAAPSISNIIGYNQVVGSLQVLSLALLITPMIAVYRGYYQGINDAKSSSVSQIIEQTVRVVCMVLALWLALKLSWSDDVIASTVMFGSFIGALTTLLWFMVRKREGKLSLQQRATYKILSKDWRKESRQLIKLALPTALATVVVPMVAVVDALSVPRLLVKFGINEYEVLAMFGQYSRIQPLTQLVSMLLAALVAGFLPRWMEQYYNLLEKAQLYKRLWQVHSIAWLIGCAATLGLYTLAEPINIMLYRDTAGIYSFQILCITVLTSCLLAVQAPLLQAAGMTMLPMSLLVIAAGSKIGFNMWLVPMYGIKGAAWSAVYAMLIPACIGGLSLFYVTTFKHMSIKKNLQISLYFIKLSLSLGGMYLILQSVVRIWDYIIGDNSSRLMMTIFVLVSVMLGALVYIYLLFLTKAITKLQIKSLLK